MSADELGLGSRWTRRSHRFWPPALLVVVTCLAYLNADHDELLFDSALLKADNLPQIVRLIWQAPLRPGYHLSYLTFLLNQAFNKAIGLDPFHITSYLVVNVLIHALNACLVFYLVRAMLRETGGGSRATWVPLAVSLLFAVHPLQASSVAYIYQRRGTLAVTFFLLAVLAYLRVRCSQPGGAAGGPGAVPMTSYRPAWPWNRVMWGAAVPLCYWLSLKSKELGLVLPFALMAVELCLRAPDRKSLRTAFRWIIPVLGLTGLSLAFFLWSRRLLDPTRFRILPWGPRDMWGPWTQFLTESRAFVHYWKLLLLPLPRWCCIDHGFATSTHLTEHHAVVAIAFHGALLLLAAAAAWKRYTLAAIGIFWFYVGLIPYAVVPQVELLVEYETYLSAVGVALILAEVLARVGGRVSIECQVAVVGAVAACLLVTTISRNVIYQSPFNLWSDAVEKSPNQARAHNNLAEVLARQGRTDDALWHYREAVRLWPDSHEVHLNYGMFLAERGQLGAALEQYQQAVSLRPEWAETHNGLGALLATNHRLDEAIREYREALRWSPDFAEAHYNLADALAKRGDNAGAIEHLNQAVRLKPSFAPAHNDLGIALVQDGKLPEALAQFREAVRIKPDDADAHYNLGLALEKTGQAAAAADEYRQVLRINGSHGPAQQRLRALSGRVGRQ